MAVVHRLRFDHATRMRALRTLVRLNGYYASLKAVPRAQRELEGRISRLARDRLSTLILRAEKSARDGTWSAIKAAQMAVVIEGYRAELYALLRDEGRKAASYGQNRVVAQVQALPGGGKGLEHRGLDRDQLRAADGETQAAVDRLVVSLGRQVQDIEGVEGQWTNLLNTAARDFGRDLANGARMVGEFDAARRHASRIAWEDSDDNFVRPSHELVDGEVVEPGQPFSNGCRFPKDPEGSLEETIACRCRIRVVA